jgi:hypothetical protein
MRRSRATLSASPVHGLRDCDSMTCRQKRFFPHHCGIVTSVGTGEIDMIGGNVDNAVVLTHIPATPDGRPSDKVVNWLVVLRVDYAH